MYTVAHSLFLNSFTEYREFSNSMGITCLHSEPQRESTCCRYRQRQQQARGGGLSITTSDHPTESSEGRQGTTAHTIISAFTEAPGR